MDFAKLLQRMTTAAEAKDGKSFAACFTEDGIYHDYIYGDHRGRASIADMLENYFHRDATDYRWRFFDPLSDGKIGYAWSLSAFTSTVPDFKGQRVVIDGMSRFELRDGLIADYKESVNGGVAMSQLGVPPERMAKVMKRWAGNLQARPETIQYLENEVREGNMRNFETVDDMKKELGKEIGVSDWVMVDQDRINKFADATGDHQWIHIDVERAKKEMPGGKTIAHGYLTLSLLPMLTAQIGKVKKVSRGINYGSNKVRFTNMVPAGSRVRARQKLIAADPVGGGGTRFTNEVTIEIEGQDKPACIAEVMSIVYP